MANSTVTPGAGNIVVTIVDGDQAYFTVKFGGTLVKRVRLDEQGQSAATWHSCQASGNDKHTPSPRSYATDVTNGDDRVFTLTPEHVPASVCPPAVPLPSGFQPATGRTNPILLDAFELGNHAGDFVYQISHFEYQIAGGETISITIVMQDNDFGGGGEDDGDNEDDDDNDNDNELRIVNVGEVGGNGETSTETVKNSAATPKTSARPTENR